MLRGFLFWGRLLRSPLLMLGLRFLLLLLLFAIWAMAAVNFLISASVDAILLLACVFASSSLLAPLLAICWIHPHSLLP
jgi:hypothetical protein